MTDSSPRTLFAARLVQARQLRGLSQRSLGDRMGLGKTKGSTRINRYEQQASATSFDSLGELAQALPTLETYRNQLSAKGLPHTHVLGNAKHHHAKLQAAENLRDAMAWWAGEKRAAGQCDQEIYRRFYLTFGLDWLGAQMRGRADMDALAARIDEKLTAPSLAARVRPT